jgi:CheY-like chemotaxis protein
MESRRKTEFPDIHISRRHGMNTILVVDDDQMLRNLLSSYFRLAFKNCRVLAAEDGAKAIGILKSKPVSLIITDLKMPNIDGYGLISYIKEHFSSVPVFVMTGAAWPLDLEMLVRNGDVIHCIAKPFNFEKLGQLVAETMGLYTAPLPPISAA